MTDATIDFIEKQDHSWLATNLAKELEALCERIEDASFGTLGAYETINAIRFLIDGHRAEDVDIHGLGDDG